MFSTAIGCCSVDTLRVQLLIRHMQKMKEMKEIKIYCVLTSFCPDIYMWLIWPKPCLCRFVYTLSVIRP